MCFDRFNAGTLTGWEINGLLAKTQLRRYLAKAIAWPWPLDQEDRDDYAEISFFPGF